jgi:hypothetical protein
VNPGHDRPASQSPREEREIDRCSVLQGEEDVGLARESSQSCEDADASPLEALADLGAIARHQVPGDEAAHVPLVPEIEEAKVEPGAVDVREQGQLNSLGAAAGEIPADAQDTHPTVRRAFVADAAAE